MDFLVRLCQLGQTPTQSHYDQLVEWIEIHGHPPQLIHLFLIACRQLQMPREAMATFARLIPGLPTGLIDQLQRQTEQVFPHSNQTPGICAVIRAHNEAQLIQSSVLSIYPHVDRIHLICHRCTDDTVHICEQLIAQGLSKIEIKIENREVVQAGDNYLERITQKSPQSWTLAEYYNHYFWQVPYEYVLKWDADMVALPTIGQYFRNCLSQQQQSMFFAGYDIFDDPYSGGGEVRLYRQTANTFYLDSHHCELLYTPYHDSATNLVVETPLYLHLKHAKGTSYVSFLCH